MKEHETTSFDARPDPVLGAALKAALEPQEQTAFVARVVAGIDAARAAPPAWDVLARWASRGIAAALVATLAAAFVSRALAAPTTLDEAFVVSSDPDTSVTTALLVADQPPDPGTVFAAVVGAER
jgi:hypothetical protein